MSAAAFPKLIVICECFQWMVGSKYAIRTDLAGHKFGNILSHQINQIIARLHRYK